MFRNYLNSKRRSKSTLSGPEEVDVKGCCRQLLLKNLTATYVAFYLLPAAHTYDFSYNGEFGVPGREEKSVKIPRT